jgi:hypothetical protein
MINMGNKKIYEKIEGNQNQIEIHMTKIEEELQKEFPNYGRIHHWQAEINNWEKTIVKLLKRIGR